MNNQQQDFILSVAPMLKRTDRHFRYFIRLLTQKTRLYTEMITTGAIVHGDRDRYLKFHPNEHPLAVQLGGSNPGELKQCATICEGYGYDEINLNVGCPSERVQSGNFGVCLMYEPELVADCIHAMSDAVKIPVTVKCRLGVDNCDSYEELSRFVKTVKNAGCNIFIIHARKAWLEGLSPKENREVPPLNYDFVYRLKKDLPELQVIINGGFTTPHEISSQLKHVDGVMIGRAAYTNPYLLTQIEQEIFMTDSPVPTRIQILEQLIPYAQREIEQGARLNHISRHILGLFQGIPGGRNCRRWISENSYRMEDAEMFFGQLIEIINRAST